VLWIFQAVSAWCQEFSTLDVKMIPGEERKNRWTVASRIESSGMVSIVDSTTSSFPAPSRTDVRTLMVAFRVSLIMCRTRKQTAGSARD